MATIGKLKPLSIQRKKKPGKYADGGGLYLVVSNAGNKTWSYRFMLKGKSREMGLGALSDVSAEEARNLATTARRQVREGIDPIEARKAHQHSLALKGARLITFDQCTSQYIDAHAPSWKNKKHGQQWTNTLATYASPLLGKLPVSAIDTNLVMQVIEPIWKTKTETATRVRRRLEAILDWAKVREFREGENPARWRGHIDKLLPPRSKVQKIKHHEALPYNEVPAFIEKLRHNEGIGALALQFTILTAARSGEVIGARPEEIDLKKELWSIPAERMKSDKPHTVPLTKSAIKIVKQVLPISGEYLFPGGKENKPLSNNGMSSVLKRMGVNVTVHGFRSSFRDFSAERTNAPSWVAEKALAHVVADKVEAAYRRGDLLDKRRALMEQWEQYCHTKPGDIVQIGKVS